MVFTDLAGITVYLAVAALLAIRLAGRLPENLDNKRLLIALGLLGVLLHGISLYDSLFTPQGTDISVFSVMSLVGWAVALLLLISAFGKPVLNLAIIILPVAALTLVLRSFTDHHLYLQAKLPLGLEAHIMLSVLAYSLLSIAVVQAILLWIQESHLHNRHPGGFIRLLAPMETMERLLFQMIGLGFILLTVALASGAFYIEDLLAQHLVHKTVLSVVAWLLFGALLFGHWRWGWRGRVAIRWTLAGFVFLMLAYFGSKTVVELILAG